MTSVARNGAVPPREVSGRAEIAESFRAGFDAWRRLPLARHLAAVVVLGLVLVARWPVPFFASAPVEDERVYARVFDRVARGESPYLESAYFYTPTFAVVGGRVAERLGTVTTLRLLRAVNLLGGAALVWCSLAWLPWTHRRRFLGAAAFLVLAPPVRFAVSWGNLSLAALGLVMVALLSWRRRPLVSAASLAASLLIKPIAPVAGWSLLIHRPAEGGRRHQVAALVGLGLAAGIVAASPYFGDFLSLGGGRPEATRSVSLHHLLYCFGVRVEAWILVVAVALAALVVLRRQPLPPGRFVAWATTLTLLATPLVWSHTLLLALPVAVMALWAAWRRRRRYEGRYEVYFVALAILAMQLSGGFGGVQTWDLWLQGLFKLLPCLAPLLLTLYVVRVAEPF